MKGKNWKNSFPHWQRLYNYLQIQDQAMNIKNYRVEDVGIGLGLCTDKDFIPVSYAEGEELAKPGGDVQRWEPTEQCCQ